MSAHKPVLTPGQKLRRELRRLISPRPRVTGADRAALAALSARGQGGRCFVIGNGPSLNAADLTMIRGEVSFASNKIDLIYEQTDWRPDFYTVEDGLVMRQYAGRIAQLKEAQKLMPLTMIHEAGRTKDMIVFPVIAPQDWSAPLRDPDFPAFSDDFAAGIAWGSTVVYTQIQLAAAMGFAEICLLGLDHSYTEGKTVAPGVLESAGERNHFHADYRPKGEIWHSPNLDVLERSYARAQAEAQARGIRILNCSRVSKLEIFERAVLEEVLERRRP